MPITKEIKEESGHRREQQLVGPLSIFREWQRKNPEWELICDIDDTDALYVGWSELPRAERMSWIGQYRDRAKEAWEEFGIRRCKVESAILNDKCELCREWPTGYAMRVFRSANV